MVYRNLFVRKQLLETHDLRIYEENYEDRLILAIEL